MSPRCEECGCGEHQPCPGGCGWVPELAAQGIYLCSRCVLWPEDLARAAVTAGIPPRPYCLLPTAVGLLPVPLEL